MENFLGMKRKAPDQCDQSRSVTKVRKTEHKSRDTWFSDWDVTFPWLQKFKWLACHLQIYASFNPFPNDNF